MWYTPYYTHIFIYTVYVPFTKITNKLYCCCLLIAMCIFLYSNFFFDFFENTIEPAYLVVTISYTKSFLNFHTNSKSSNHWVKFSFDLLKRGFLTRSIWDHTYIVKSEKDARCSIEDAVRYSDNRGKTEYIFLLFR